MLTACPKETVLKLSYNFVKRKVARNTVLYRQNDKADAIYLVKSGVIQLERTVSEPEDFEELTRKYTLLDQEAIKKYMNRMEMGGKKARMVVPVSQCTKGVTFGDYELVFKRRRVASAVCVSEKASLYCLPKHIFESIVHENRFVLNDMKSLAVKKMEVQEKQVVNHIASQLKYRETVLNPTQPSPESKEAFAQHLPQGPWKTVCQTSQQLLSLQQTISCLSRQEGFYRQFASDPSQPLKLDTLTQNLKAICVESSNDIYKTIRQIDSDKKEDKKFFKNKMIDYSQYLAPLKKAKSQQQI